MTTRRSRRAGLLCAAVFIAALADAGPQGGQITSGSGRISQSNTTTTIQQSSEALGVNWQSFNVAANETVNFKQPNSSAIAINRILSSTGSEILGHVNANGQVWLINPNGVLFGKGSQIDVGGLVASSLDSNGVEADGSAHFSGSGKGSIVNRGTISAGSGYVALIGNQTSNEGVITARLGTVAEVGGSAVTLSFDSNHLLQVEVDQSTLGNLAENHGLIAADGGAVYMTAGARNALLASSVNNSGVISATGIEHHNGSAVLTAGTVAGEVTVGGTVDVSSSTGTGGEVTATGRSVDVASGANIDASGASGGGAIRIGGGWEGGEGIAQATTVKVAQGATLNASAIRAGDGGEVVVRSDVDADDSTTRDYGTLLAQGGAAGGNGGRIETSGHWLDVTGGVAKASAGGKGVNGEWLLDPYNVIIAATGTAVAAGSYVPSADSTISASSIATALQGGSNVTITTGTSGSSIGDITVSSAITKASGNTNVTLTLQAADSIIINAPISNTGGTGKLNLDLYADNDNGTHDGVGSVLLTQSLSTGGGFISFGNGATMTVNGVANTLVGGDVYVGGSSAVNLTTAGGAVSFNGQTIVANTGGLNIDTVTGASVGGNVLFASFIDSGDTYAYVTSNGNVPWSTALSDAKSGSGGNTGDTYLATITSRLENAVASSTAAYNPSWLGGQRVVGIGTDAVWRWVAGPEGLQNSGQGLGFFTQNGSASANGSGGTAINGAYTNWNAGEPNNYNGPNIATCTECALQLVGTAGQWNDWNGSSNTLPYIVETNLGKSPLSVNAGTGSSGGTVTLSAAIGQSKALSNLTISAQSLLLNSASTNITTAGTETINGSVQVNGTTVNILHVNAPSYTTTYDATLPTFTPTYSGFVNGDTAASLSTQATASTTGNTSHVSSAPITVSGAVDSNYFFLYNNGTLLVNPAPVTVTGTTVATKTYDGTTTATVANGALSGVFSADAANVSLTQFGAFNSANAGVNVGVTLTDSIGGSASSNYTLTEPTTVTGTINPKSLTVTGTTVAAKTYNGTAAATLSNGALSGVLSADVSQISLTQSGTFASSHAGTGITVVGTDSLLGSLSGNYVLTQPSGLTGTINTAPLTVSGASVVSKPYDGTTAAVLNGVLSGVVSSDLGNVMLAQTGVFASKNVGSNIAVTTTEGLLGSAASNYSLTDPTGLSGTINLATLTVSGTAVTAKTYDGTTAASLTSGTLVGVVSGEASGLTLTQAGSFVSSNAGTGIGVTAADTVTGSASSNYTLAQPTGVTGTINPKSLTVTGTTVAAKTYTGTSAATLSNGALSGVLAADLAQVSLTQAGAFVSSNAGTGIGVTAADALAGNASANYALTQPTGLTSTINPATLTVSGTTVTPKTYNGNTAATLASGTLAGVVTSDLSNVTLTQAGTFANKNVGSNITVAAIDGLTGSAAANYSLTEPTGLTGTINVATLTVSGTAVASKTYDGTTAATVSNGTLAGVVSGEASGLTLTQAGSFVSSNAGSSVGVTTADTLTGSASSNYTLAQPTGVTGTINPASLTVSGASVVSKSYDGTTAAVLNGVLSGVVTSDLGNVALTQTGVFASKNVGSAIGVTATEGLIGSAASNYSLTEPTGLSGTINPATLTITGTTVASKTYDGTMAASVSNGTLAGVVSGEASGLTLTQAGSFVSSNAGPAVGVTIADTVTGSASSNYTLTQPTGVTGTINPATLTVSGASVVAKTYDGSTAATLANGMLVGVLTSDLGHVTLTQTGLFASKNVGSTIGVTATEGLTGSAAANYSLTEPSGLSGTISPATLTVTGTTVASKIYDGTMAATLANGTLAGVVSGEASGLTLTQAGSFVSSNAGPAVGVTTADTLTGSASSNYTLTQPSGVTGTINPATLTVTGTTVASKIYDGTMAATLANGTLAGIVAGDASGLTLTQAGSFVSSNAGIGIGVTAADTVTGSASSNYTLAQPTGLTSSINPATLTVSGASVVAKPYDGTTSAVLNGVLAGVVTSDLGNVGLTQTGTFASKNVGSAIGVTATEGLTGSAASNYNLTEPTGLSGTINFATLTVAGTTVASKTYDGTTAATLSNGTLAGVVSGEASGLTLTQVGSFVSSNAGIGVGVTAADLVTGSASSNYTLAQPTGVTGTINPATLTVSGASVAPKIYNGTTAATLANGTLVGVLTGDLGNVALTQTGLFASKNVGSNIGVTATEGLTGSAASNYSLTEPTGLSGTINPATLTVIGTTVASKTYDGTVAASVSNGTLAGVVSGEASGLTLTQAGSFISSNAGTSVGVTTADTVTGSASSNYTLTQPTGVTGTINPATLTVGGTTVASKTYDGTTVATLASGMLAGVLTSDLGNVALTQAGTFATKNVGSNITVAALDGLSGSAASNYSLTEPTGLSGAINPATLTVSGASVVSKPYDGTTSAVLNGVLSGVVTSDVGNVGLTQTGNFASKNVGSNIGVTPTEGLTGSAASNYSLTEPTGLTGTINAATLTVSGTTVASKTYDGTTAATLTSGVLAGVVSGEASGLTLTQGGSFVSSNAGIGVSVTAADTVTGSASSNYTLAQPTGLTSTITPATLTVNGASVVSKPYDGTTAAVLNGVLSGVVTSDLGNVALSQTGVFASKNVGSAIGVTATESLLGSAASNYNLTEPTGLAGTINAATLTVSGTTVASKTYDGTTAASVSNGTLAGVVSGEASGLTLTQAGSFVSSNAGSSVGVMTADTVTGSASSNYTLAQPTGVTGTITPATLTVSGTTVVSKTYDGTTAATLANGMLTGVVTSDLGNVTLTPTGVFASKNVGSSIGVTATEGLIGSAASNYSLTEPTGLTGTITPATLTVSGTTVASKTYDGTTAAMVSNGTLAGVVSGEASGLTLTQAGSFITRNAGVGVGVTTADTVTGSASSNYTLTQPMGVTGTITPATLTVSGTTVASKTYDGTTAATLANGMLTGVVTSDLGNVALTQAGTFASKNVGSTIVVAALDGLSGNAASNYSLTEPTGLSGTINPATLTVSGTTVASKTYDGTTSATLGSGTLAGVVAGEASGLTLTQAGSFISSNVGTGVGVTAADTVTGSASSNYLLTQPMGVTGTITPATLTVSGTTVAPKTYDGTTVATLAGGTLAGIVTSDLGSVTLTQAGTFAIKNVGSNIVVAALDGLSGSAASNYSLTEPIGLSGTINPAALTVSGTTVASKTYDGTAAATLGSGTLVGVVAGEASGLTLTQAGSFVSSNAGPNIGVTAADTLTGGASSNYTLAQPIGLTGMINPAALTVSGTVVAPKTYDGTTIATLASGTLTGVVTSDLGNVALTQAGFFASKNVGPTIAVAALDGLSGSAAANYTLSEPTGLSGTINPATLTVIGTTVASKTYDGTTAATLGSGALAGVVTSDLGSVTLTQAGSFVSSNAGTGIGVTAADAVIGSASSNYSLTQPSGLTSTITPATLTVSGTTVAPKTYDGTTTATLASGMLAGVVTSDLGNVTLTQAGTFASKNVGSAVAVGALDGLSGSAASNYTLTEPSGLSGTITAAPLTVSGTTIAPKTYDGTTVASVSNGTLAGVVAGEASGLILTQAGNFVSSNAGTGIGVTAADTVAGSAAANYTLTQPTGLTSSITPATLTVSGTTVAPKTYDGTTVATLASGTLTGVVASDLGNVVLTQAGTFATKNVGSTIAVAALDGLSGSAASNYNLTEPTGLSGTINPATLTVSGTTVAAKTYDGTTAAALASGTLAGVVAGETSGLTLTQSGSFVSSNAGTGIGVTAADTLTGSASSNYTLVQPTGLTSTIIPATLTVSGTTVAPKTYDGTTVATLASGTLTGVVPGDAPGLAVTQAGNFISSNAGTGIGVIATDILTGSASSNYALTQPTGLTSTINPASLTVSGTTVASKTYDGTTVAILANGTLAGVLTSDFGNVTLTQAGTFASKNVGSNIAVAALDGLSGSAASNYVLVEPTSLNGSIAPAALLAVANSTAVANGSGAFTPGGTFNGFVAGESLGVLAAQGYQATWISSAGNNPGVGYYSVTGSFSDPNYSVAQAAGNADAESVGVVASIDKVAASGGQLAIVLSTLSATGTSGPTISSTSAPPSAASSAAPSAASSSPSSAASSAATAAAPSAAPDDNVAESVAPKIVLFSDLGGHRLVIVGGGVNLTVEPSSQ